jgi:hypothetical protein
MRKRILALPVLALTAGLLGAAPAQAANGHGSAHGNAPAGNAPVQTTPVSSTTASKGKAVFLAAQLSGDQEVPTPGGPAVGDRDGRAVALVKVKGNRVSFALEYKGIGAPTLGHIHQGAAGTNGPVKVNLFTTAMPDTIRAAAGAVTVDDAAVADAIRKDPAGFYVNLHSKEFPGGAVRGQLKALGRSVDLLDVVRGGKLRAFLDAEQEVDPGNGKAFGDKNGRAVSFVRPKGDRIEYSAAWVGIAAPSVIHIHQGKFGTNGDIRTNLVSTPVPDGIFAISGTVSDVDRTLVRDINRKPSGFYVNIHTAEFPGGALRGQLFR